MSKVLDFQWSTMEGCAMARLFEFFVNYIYFYFMETATT